MNPWINYHHLFYFKTIVEEGSVSKAAEKLLIGQPTLSSQLKQLEENMGVLLFERKHKKLLITEHGKIAYEYAQNIFKMGSEMFEVLHDRVRPLKPTIHIGALDSIPKNVISQIVKNALKIAPCQITLSEGNSDELLRELATHKIDLVISDFLPSGIDAKGISTKLISKKNVAFYGVPEFKKLRKNFPKSVSGKPLVFPTYDSKLRLDLDHWAKLNEVELNIVVESQDVAVKKLLALNSLGLIATASHTVTRHVLEGQLVELGKLKGVHEELHLLMGNRKVPNFIAKKLFDKFIV